MLQPNSPGSAINTSHPGMELALGPEDVTAANPAYRARGENTGINVDKLPGCVLM